MLVNSLIGPELRLVDKSCLFFLEKAKDIIPRAVMWEVPQIETING